VLLGTAGDAARIRREDAQGDESPEVLLPMDDMAEARLVLTDALIAESLRRGKAAERQRALEVGEGETVENDTELNQPRGKAARGRQTPCDQGDH
jgi:ribosome maturation factor RimP